MQVSSIPVKMPVTWGANAGAGFIRTVPIPSQIGINAGYASFTDGFVPLNFVNPNAGGVPPWGQDFNGIFNVVTAWLQWAQAGAPLHYDSSFSTGIGGYPQYALIASASTPGAWWQSQVDNNVSDPDTGGANWVLCTMQQPYLDARYLKVTPTNTFYVNGTTGNDNYNGQSPTVGTGVVGPFKTIGGAVRAINSSYSFAGVTINVAAGTYGGFSVTPSLIANWDFVGSGASTCIISSVFNDATFGYAVDFSGSTGALTGFTINGYTYGVVADTASHIYIYSCNFGPSTLGSCVASVRGSLVDMLASTYGSTTTIAATGSGNAFVTTWSGAYVQFGFTNSAKTSPNTLNVALNFTGATFASGTVICSEGSTVLFSPANVTFTGTPTGPRFNLDNGTILVNGSGLSYIPGSSAGVIASAMLSSGSYSGSTYAAGIYQ